MKTVFEECESVKVQTRSRRFCWTMPGHTCIVCGNNPSQDPSVSFHRFPSDPERRVRWLSVGMDETQLRSQSRVCSRHFPDGDVKKEPMVTLGKRFASPIKGKDARVKRAKARNVRKELAEVRSSVSPFRLSKSVTPVEQSPLPTPPETALIASVGEQLKTSYQVHELPSDDGGKSDTASTSVLMGGPSQSTEVLVNTALLARIESLEVENSRLKTSINSKPQYFRIEQIQNG